MNRKVDKVIYCRRINCWITEKDSMILTWLRRKIGARNLGQVLEWLINSDQQERGDKLELTRKALNEAFLSSSAPGK